MKDTLLSLYYGNSVPMDKFYPRSKEYRKKRDVYHSHYEEFAKKLEDLDPQMGEQFREIIDEQLKSAVPEYEETFIGGFRLGAKMMLEIFEDDPADGE